MKKPFKFKNAKGEEFDVAFRKPNKRFFGKDCDGYCTAERIVINPYRTNKTQLNTSIHEFAHAFFWDKTEKEVTKFANSLTKFLYSHCGWRRKVTDSSWPREKS